MKKYNAFISYSHREDRYLATQLQLGLQRFAKPWFKIRSVNVFRDDTNLNLSPDLWQSITKALDNSEYFLLLCNPVMTQSYWVGEEIKYWMKHHDVSKIILVLTDGNLLWDNVLKDFNIEKTNALHPELNGFFKNDPFFLDLRWAKTATDLSLQNPDFKKDIAVLSATIRNISVADILGVEVEQLKRTRRIRNSVIVALSLLLLCSVLLGLNAYRAQQTATANNYITESILELQQRNDPVNSYRLARRAHDLKPNLASKSAMLAAQLNSGFWINEKFYPATFYESLQLNNNIKSISLSPDGKITAFCSGNAVYWKQTNSSTYDSLTVPIDNIIDVLAGMDGRIICSGESSSIFIIDTQSKTFKSVVLNEYISTVFKLALSPDGRYIAAGCNYNSIVLISTENFEIKESVWHPYFQKLNYFDKIFAVCFSRDNTLISGSSDGSIILWAKDDKNNLAPSDSFRIEDRVNDVINRVNDVIILPDNKHLAIATKDKKIYITDKSGNILYNTAMHTNSVTSLDISHDGKYLASASSDMKINLYSINYDDLNCPKLNILSSFEGHKNWVNKIAFDKSDNILYSVSRDATLRKWAIKPANYVKRMVFEDLIYQVVWKNDENAFLAKSSGLYYLNTQNSKIDTIVSKDSIYRIDYNVQKNTIVYHSNNTQKILLMDLKDNSVKIIDSCDKKTSVRKIVFSPDGERIAVSYSYKEDQVEMNQFKIMNTKGEILYQPSLRNTLITAIYFYSGKIYLTYSYGLHTGVLILDEQYNTVSDSKNIHEEAIITLKKHDYDDNKILTTSYDGSAKVWTKDMQQLLSLDGHGRFVYDIAVAKINKEYYYITSSWDGYCRIWDENGKMLNQIALYGNQIGLYIKVSRKGDKWITIGPTSINEWDIKNI